MTLKKVTSEVLSMLQCPKCDMKMNDCFLNQFLTSLGTGVQGTSWEFNFLVTSKPFLEVIRKRLWLANKQTFSKSVDCYLDKPFIICIVENPSFATNGLFQLIFYDFNAENFI